MVNLYKLASSKARLSNYEQILRMLNDCLQGTAEAVGFLLGGTPDFLYDPRKGLYSYEAIQSRLNENAFAKAAGVTDYDAPILHLGSLTPEELYVLLGNIRNVYAAGDPAKYLVPDEALAAFLAHCSQKIGEAYFRTPRTTIRPSPTSSPCWSRTRTSGGTPSSTKFPWRRTVPPTCPRSGKGTAKGRPGTTI